MIEIAPRRTSRICSDTLSAVSIVRFKKSCVSFFENELSVNERLLFRRPVCQIVFLIESTFLHCDFSENSKSTEKFRNVNFSRKVVNDVGRALHKEKKKMMFVYLPFVQSPSTKLDEFSANFSTIAYFSR